MAKRTALEKRIKRKITGQAHTFFAACPPGLKQLCFDEFKNLDLTTDPPAVTSGGVEFQAKPDAAMQANLWLGSPIRVLMRVAEFKATHFDQLEKKISAVDWPVILSPGQIKFKATLHKSKLYHSDAVIQRIENAIKNNWHSSDLSSSDTDTLHTLYIRADHDRFTISVDTSGEPLFKRGIKKRVTPAPLRENLAWAMLKWTGFSDNDLLVDPMCGSGTFSLEAALMLTRTPPGYFRSFAFRNLPGFSRKTWQYLKTKVKDQMIPPAENQIFASDSDTTAIEALNENSKINNFDKIMQIRKKDFFSIDPANFANGRKGVILINPPYGKRIGHDRSKQLFFKELKIKLQKDFKGWRLGIILPGQSDMALLNLGLKVKPVFHGGIDAKVGVGLI